MKPVCCWGVVNLPSHRVYAAVSRPPARPTSAARAKVGCQAFDFLPPLEKALPLYLKPAPLCKPDSALITWQQAQHPPVPGSVLSSSRPSLSTLYAFKKLNAETEGQRCMTFLPAECGW